MSNFKCEHCGAICCDTPYGYITGCEHYPADKLEPSTGSEAADFLIAAMSRPRERKE